MLVSYGFLSSLVEETPKYLPEDLRHLCCLVNLHGARSVKRLVRLSFKTSDVFDTRCPALLRC
jgi:hypothetical protein